MKKLIFPLLVAAVAIMSFTTYSGRENNPTEDIEIPENVKKVIDAKCAGCHSGDSKSLKAKTKLKFEDLSSLSKTKLISKLDEIAEELEEGKMPPENFLKKYPDKKLNDDESKLVIEWAHAASDKLLE